MQHHKPLRWEIDASSQEPVVIFFREVEGHGNVRTKPFNKQDLMHEIDVKRTRGDDDVKSWQEALQDLTHLH